MSTQDDGSPLVQLGRLEVSEAALDEEGDYLDSFTNNLLLHPAFIADRALTVPLMGWRIVRETEANDDAEATQILAAPHPSKVDAWVTAVRISSQDGFATYRYDPDPMIPVQPKTQRRAQLALHWPADHTSATSLARLRIFLVNTSTQPWFPTSLDDFFVTGVIEADEHGTEVAGGGFFAYIDGTPEASPIPPGGTCELRVDIEQSFLDRLLPGKYLVMAVLVSLELSSTTTFATKY